MMKIVSLIDNLHRGVIPGTEGSCCRAEHGLSLYVELDCGARVLFDMGQGSLFAENASTLGIEISTVDLAVISHGHYDHAGGLSKFLEINKKALVYIRPEALDNHYSVKDYGLKPIGVDTSGLNLADSGRLVFCREVEHLPYGITLFSNPPDTFPTPPGNSLLLGPDAGTPDDFMHEQSMIVTETGSAGRPYSVLFGGCAHRGIANILSLAEILSPCPVTDVFSGMHLTTLFRGTDNHADEEYVCTLAESLLSHQNVHYWTMHCTGEEAFRRLSELMPGSLDYLPCGCSILLSH